MKPCIDLVAIGASAGGVEAVGALLAALPADFPAAVLVVLHVPPDRPSLLAGLFASRCALPVREAVDKEPLEPGSVRIAPPDYHLLVEPGATLALSMDEPVNFSRPSIDLLFESAAYARGPSALGIVLSGASADGAAGLAAIRAAGGLGWVQDPSQAYAAMMPAAAITRAGADRVMGLEEMAGALAALAGGGPQRQEKRA